MGRHFDPSNPNSVRLSSNPARSLPPGAPPLPRVPRPILPSPTATRRVPSTAARAPNVPTCAPLEAQTVQPGRAGVNTLPPQLQTQVHGLPARNLGIHLIPYRSQKKRLFLKVRLMSTSACLTSAQHRRAGSFTRCGRDLGGGAWGGANVRRP